MESHKHNDDLIKRKLDSVSVEPGKLNFTKLHAEYQKAQKSSSKKWLLIWFFIILSIGGFFTGYFLINTSSDVSNSQLAVVNQVNPITTKTDPNLTANLTESQQVNGKVQMNSPTLPNAPTVALNTNQSSDQTNSIPEIRSATTSHEDFKAKSTTSAINADVNNSAVKENNKTNRINSKTKTNASLPLTSTVAGSDQAAVTEASAGKKINTNKGTKAKTASTLNLKSATVISSAGAANTNTSKIAAGTKKETASGTKQSGNTTIQEKQNASEISQNTVTTSANKLADASDEEGKNKDRKTTSEKDSTVQISTSATDSVDKGKNNPKINDPKTNDLLANTTPSNSAEKQKDHRFSISTELVYSNISYSAKPNTKAANMYTGSASALPQQFCNGVTGDKYRLLSGAAILGYSYKNSIGVNVGLGFFNVETIINGKAFAQTKTTMAFDHYTYDSTMQIIDTVYKVASTRQVNVVNGDTVDARDYLNNIRFVTIPLNFSYKFNLNKLAFEPQVGIQYAMPVKSYQLVADPKPYQFNYSKNKSFLKSSDLFFDLALKLSYKIGANASIYIKQGYFFNNRSIYNVDYLMDYRIKSVYTSFGINILLK